LDANGSAITEGACRDMVLERLVIRAAENTALKPEAVAAALCSVSRPPHVLSGPDVAATLWLPRRVVRRVLADERPGWEARNKSEKNVL
jgi:hypothetical protein